jgi:ring-1,2-phenylacetyl-CoA epoxidase subunit PaaD
VTSMTEVDLAAARVAAEAVPDPELPPVTLGMLGVIHDVRADGGRVEIDLLPTFAGCPATEMMTRDVRDAVAAVPGVTEVVVHVRFSPAWTPDRMSSDAQDALRSFGIAPTIDVPAGRRLPVLTDEDTDTDRRTCPYCGSAATERQSLFGPTPCRDVRYCRDCRQPFEGFKA